MTATVLSLLVLAAAIHWLRANPNRDSRGRFRPNSLVERWGVYVALAAAALLLLAGCGARSAVPDGGASAGAGQAVGSVESARDAIERLKAGAPREQWPLLELTQSALARAAASLAAVQDQLRAAAVERDQLRTERDRAAEEVEAWRGSWLGGRGHKWLNRAILLGTVGVILRLVALLVLGGWGHVVSLLGSLCLCVSVLFAPLILVFEYLFRLRTGGWKGVVA